MPKPRCGFGAEGIGLCRTEHMFFAAERIIAVREMIVAETTKSTGAEVALAKLLPMQKKDFIEMFRIMDGLPVTIRLLDPPLARIPAAFRRRNRRRWPTRSGSCR